LFEPLLHAFIGILLSNNSEVQLLQALAQKYVNLLIFFLLVSFLAKYQKLTFKIKFDLVTIVFLIKFPFYGVFELW
jgi:hypothetical protein